jgi:hypothetical protein
LETLGDKGLSKMSIAFVSGILISQRASRFTFGTAPGNKWERKAGIRLQHEWRLRHQHLAATLLIVA